MSTIISKVAEGWRRSFRDKKVSLVVLCNEMLCFVKCPRVCCVRRGCVARSGVTGRHQLHLAAASVGHLLQTSFACRMLRALASERDLKRCALLCVHRS